MIHSQNQKIVRSTLKKIKKRLGHRQIDKFELWILVNRQLENRQLWNLTFVTLKTQSRPFEHWKA